jgi:hypothetical protein
VHCCSSLHWAERVKLSSESTHQQMMVALPSARCVGFVPIHSCFPLPQDVYSSVLCIGSELHARYLYRLRA